MTISEQLNAGQAVVDEKEKERRRANRKADR
jgi:hypothetical protein